MAQQSKTKILSLAVMNLVTSKAGAKHELLFNKPASEGELLTKSLCLAAALGVTKFMKLTTINLVKLCCPT